MRANGCEHPIGLYTALQGLKSPQGVLLAPCNRCLSCYRQKRAELYVKMQKGIDVLLEQIPEEDRDIYLFLNARFLTPTERSPAYRPRGDRYSVTSHATRSRQLSKRIRKRADRWHAKNFGTRAKRRRATRNHQYTGKPSIWKQNEPQGMKAGLRLHPHLLIIGYPMPTWDGPGKTGETLAEWLHRISNSDLPGDRMALDLWNKGWGVSDCQPVMGVRDLGRYMTKEVNTADGPLSEEQLQAAFYDGLKHRRVRMAGYSKPWYGLEHPDWYRRAPVWQRPKMVHHFEEDEVLDLKAPVLKDGSTNVLAIYDWEWLRENANRRGNELAASLNLEQVYDKMLELNRWRQALLKRADAAVTRARGRWSTEDYYYEGWDLLELTDERLKVMQVASELAALKKDVEAETGTPVPWSWQPLYQGGTLIHVPSTRPREAAQREEELTRAPP